MKKGSRPVNEAGYRQVGEDCIHGSMLKRSSSPYRRHGSGRTPVAIPGPRLELRELSRGLQLSTAALAAQQHLLQTLSRVDAGAWAPNAAYSWPLVSHCSLSSTAGLVTVTLFTRSRSYWSRLDVLSSVFLAATTEARSQWHCKRAQKIR